MKKINRRLFCIQLLSISWNWIFLFLLFNDEFTLLKNVKIIDNVLFYLFHCRRMFSTIESCELYWWVSVRKCTIDTLQIKRTDDVAIVAVFTKDEMSFICKNIHKNQLSPLFAPLLSVSYTFTFWLSYSVILIALIHRTQHYLDFPKPTFISFHSVQSRT